jgi:hypothetical protein
MKIYVTKYALSRGVLEVDAVVYDKGFAVVRNSGRTGFDQYFHGEGREWCHTKEQAFDTAETMRIKRIASLEQQVAKLKAMTFAAEEGANV